MPAASANPAIAAAVAIWLIGRILELARRREVFTRFGARTTADRQRGTA